MFIITQVLVLAVAIAASVDSYELIAAGASFPAPVYQVLSIIFKRDTNIDMTYTSLGSSKGVCRVLNDCTDTAHPPQEVVDFAGSDSLF